MEMIRLTRRVSAGVSEDYQEIKDWELEYGRGLQYIDMYGAP